MIGDVYTNVYAQLLLTQLHGPLSQPLPLAHTSAYLYMLWALFRAIIQRCKWFLLLILRVMLKSKLVQPYPMPHTINDLYN